MNQGFIVDHSGNLTVDISNSFGFTDDTITIGDEDHTESIAIPTTLSISQDVEIL